MPQAGESEDIPITTTHELIAAILFFSQEDIFHEAEIVSRVKKLRRMIPGCHAFDQNAVFRHLRSFLYLQVLHYAGISDRYIIDRRENSYLRHVLTNAHIFPDLEMRVRELVAYTDTTDRALTPPPQTLQA